MFYPCPCCGYLTIGENRKWEICPICFWEDDLFQYDNPDLKGGANNMSLKEAQKNFKEFGAIDKESLKLVRKPTDDEYPSKSNCDYFYDTCLKECLGYFSQYNFTYKANIVGGLIFQRDNIFVEVSYDCANYPRYYLTLTIGFGSGAYDDSGKFTGVPIWKMVPDDLYSVLNFSNNEELRQILILCKSLILEEYIEPLLEDQKKLKNLVGDNS